jgi:hypothetical protein
MYSHADRASKKYSDRSVNKPDAMITPPLSKRIDWGAAQDYYSIDESPRD